MIPSRKMIFALLGAAALMTACSGLKTNSSGGSGTGSYSIGGTVSGLAGTGLTLTNNGVDTLAVTGTGTVQFTFATPVSGAYDVEVQTQPSNPAQVCTAGSNKGTAAANVTTVAVTCTTTPVSAKIGGTISGLATGASVILQNNGGDALTLTANGAFTFKTAVTGPTDAYAVTVNTQPTTPNQICTVAHGSGTATADVTNVAVTCVLSYTIGGTVSGVVGSGMTLQDSNGDTLKIPAANGNQTFTFAEFVPTGYAYTVTISAQPTSPGQTCVVTPGTGSGTATANVTSVVVTCPAVTYSVGGTVVGLAGVPTSNGALTDGSFILQNVLGNTLTITANGPFTFATPEALNDQYQLSVFHGPSTQGEGCTLWDYKGVITGNVSDIVVDCGHNDWTWIDGTKTAGTAVPARPQYGSLPLTAPTPTTPVPNPFTNTPGARYGAAGWTDQFGSLFLFGGDGWELSGKTGPDTLNGPMNDMWVCDMSWGEYCQWQLVGAYDPTVSGSTTIGALIIANAQNEGQGISATTPLGARLGSAAWTDASGNFWLFGGSTGSHFLNDLWKYDPSALSPLTYTTKEGQWTWEGGSPTLADESGNYTSGTLLPGARTNAVTWTDASGNLWLFGGYGYDGSGNIGFLNDLWKFNGTTWTWISGGSTNLANQFGNYGAQGTPASSNMPGGRQEAVGWADSLGNLWLFGGEGMDSVGTANGILNDLWVYNIASNQWTWVMGSIMANQTGEYGMQPFVGPPSTTGAAGTVGLPSGTTSTQPGSRWGASGWVDGGGNFWLFGGWGLDSTATNGNGGLNDLWVYTPSATAGQAGVWTWVKGSNTGSDNGDYGDLTRPYLTYYQYTPGGRSNATHWVDNNGQLWLFGGEGYDSTSTTGNGYLNDLWRYLPYQDY